MNMRVIISPEEMEAGKMRGRPWTSADCLRLRELAAKGMNRHEIGEALGRTAPAVSGAAERFGIVILKVLNSRPYKVPREKYKANSDAEAKLADHRALITLRREAVSRGILELQEHHCRWPVSERTTSDGRKDYRFCCAEKETGKPYCAGHVKAAYSLKRGAE